MIGRLKSDIIRLEGFKTPGHSSMSIGLGPINAAFPNGTFPTGSVHEFLSEESAATSGFIAGILSMLMNTSGTAIWISSNRSIFPPALRSFGLQPDRIIFADLQKERDILWAIDEALKCSALTAVIGEVKDFDFMASRRLQLAVEKSLVTGFILRSNVLKTNPTACVSRWRITSLPSEPMDGLPGIGFPQWKVELLKMRNGRPGVWNVRWMNGKFGFVYPSVFQEQKQKAG